MRQQRLGLVRVRCRNRKRRDFESSSRGMEHGGAAPVILCDDADLALAVPSLVKGGYYHAGQVCVSVQRIFVDQRIKQDFMASFADAVRDLIAGPRPLRRSTERRTPR